MIREFEMIGFRIKSRLTVGAMMRRIRASAGVSDSEYRNCNVIDLNQLLCVRFAVRAHHVDE